MKKITLLTAIFVAFTMNAQITVWEDSFDSYSDFEIETIGDWSQIDVDLSATYGSFQYNWLNENYIGTAIVFNSVNMDDADPNNPADRTDWEARTGDKGLYMFAAQNTFNDDYIITPQINLTDATDSMISFWAKSVTDFYGLERFEVLISTSGTDIADFSDIGGGELLAPLVYTEYSYDLSAYDGQLIYIAIHYVGQKAFILQMDDFLVEANVLSIGDNLFNDFTYYVDSYNTLNLNANTSLESVQLYNVLGQQVVSQKLSNSNETISLASFETGIYVAKVSIDGNTKTFKIIKK